MSDDPTLRDALADVRKAYRLLWGYQRRVFDMVGLVAGEFEDMAFYNWRTIHSDHPCRTGTDPMGGRWTWDMLPMTRVSYLFLPDGVDRNSTLPGQWMLEVHVNSDTGFVDPEDGIEPDPAGFERAEGCRTLLSIFAWYCRGETDRNWYGGVWNVLDWPEAGSGGIDHADPPFSIFRRDLDMADLPDKDAVRAAVASFRTDAEAALGVRLA